MKRNSTLLWIGLILVTIINLYSTIKTNRRIDHLFDMVHEIEGE